MMDIIDPLYETKLPDYPRAERMRTTKLGSECTYYTF